MRPVLALMIVVIMIGSGIVSVALFLFQMGVFR
jgi:hypothetical protein